MSDDRYLGQDVTKRGKVFWDASGPGCSGPASDGALQRGSAPPPLDFQQLIDRCLGNLALAERVLAKFDDGFCGDVQRLQQGLAEQDADAVVLVAHRLKGSAANVAAPELQRVTSRIESLARSQRLMEAVSQMEQLHQEWRRYREFTQTLPRACVADGSRSQNMA